VVGWGEMRRRRLDDDDDAYERARGWAGRRLFRVLACLLTFAAVWEAAVTNYFWTDDSIRLWCS
jgi:hypothetical protein